MAQWSHADKTLFAKLVYYGPAFGGKTTTLETLHRLTAPSDEHEILSVKTPGDRTLFFDLLPFDLGTILGYDVGIKVYTVPGQVRYDTTRQIVLSAADAVIFVADSTTSREEHNRWSLQNLTMNMRSQGIDPAKIPVLYQFNKQDRGDAADPAQVAGWLGIPEERGLATVATEGRGVLDTFIAASKAMLLKIHEQAGEKTRAEIDPAELRNQVERAFAPFKHRTLKQATSAKSETSEPVVLEGNDLLADAIKTQTEMAEQLGDANARVRRQSAELEALRRFDESMIEVGPCLDAARHISSVLQSAATILQASIVSLVGRSAGGAPIVECCHGADSDPLIASPDGTSLLAAMMQPDARVVDELRAGPASPDRLEILSGFRSAACVATGDKADRFIMVYAPRGGRRLHVDDIRFLERIGARLEVGLEQIRLHREVAGHRDELERVVEQRTAALCRAYEELKVVEQTRDRLINNVSHEMRTPLTAILGAATFVKDYRSNAGQRAELMQSVLDSGKTLQQHFDRLIRVAEFDGVSELNPEPTTPRELLEAAAGLSEAGRISIVLPADDGGLFVDHALVARAVGNLLDNAIKFSPPDTPVNVALAFDGDGIRVVVSDRGQGVVEEERERIFAPFEQGPSPSSDKPAGLGLGLYETMAIARRHGGGIRHEHRNGGGSRFVLTLPGTRAEKRQADDTKQTAEVAHA